MPLFFCNLSMAKIHEKVIRKKHTQTFGRKKYLLDVLSIIQLIWSQNITMTNRSNKRARKRDAAATITVENSAKRAQLSSRQTAHFHPMRTSACVLPRHT